MKKKSGKRKTCWLLTGILLLSLLFPAIMVRPAQAATQAQAQAASRKLAAGGYYSLALKQEGTIAGWGDGSYGKTTPPAGNNYIAVSAGGDHSLAIKQDGTIVGWGYNSDGQAAPPAGNNFTAVSAGQYHSLALRQDGTIVGWGLNNSGQATAPAGNNYIAIAAGGFYSLALRQDGTIVGWGNNYCGQATPPAGNDYIAIAAGTEHALALKQDGTIIGWGKTGVPSNLNLSGELSRLWLSRGSLSPAFDPNQSAYTAELPNGITELDISAEMALPAAYNLEINGVLQSNGVAKTIPLAVGPNVVTLDVIEKSTGLDRTYTLTLNRAGSDSANADLFELSTGSGILSPAFQPNISDYTVNLDNTVSSLDVTAVPSDALATLTIAGQALGSGTQTKSVSLESGDNDIIITVRSNDASNEKSYRLKVVRAPSSNALLSSLSVEEGSIYPAFKSRTVAYQLQGAGDVDSIKITAETADPDASVLIAGQAAQQGTAQTVALEEGVNLIPIVVTAPDGVIQQCYILSVNGAVDDADLASLAITEQALQPDFDPTEPHYELTVPNRVGSLEITAAPSDDQALMVLNGSLLAAGTPVSVDLTPGLNTLNLMVVAQDATTKTYVIDATREAAVAIDSPALSPAIVNRPYRFILQASGGQSPYNWTAENLPDWLGLNDTTGELTGTPSQTGSCTITVTVREQGGSTASQDFTLEAYNGNGNSAYVITPVNDGTYTAGLSAHGISTMTVNKKASGLKYFYVDIIPVSGHDGEESLVFVQLRRNSQIAISISRADYDVINRAGVGFNVRAGDVIKVYLVDALGNDPAVSPVVL